MSLAALGVLVYAPSSGAGVSEGAAPLTIVTTVDGPVPAGTTFTATLQCDSNIIVGDGGTATDTATVTFDATGQPTSPDTFLFGEGGTCTVTETATGGAATTSYACEGSIPDPVVPKGTDAFPAQVDPDAICPAAGPQADPVTVNINDPDQEATVTIANTFVAAPVTPAAQIVAQPAFTG